VVYFIRHIACDVVLLCSLLGPANKGSRAGVAYSRLFKYTQQLLCRLYRNEDWAPYPIMSVLCYLSQNPVRNPLRQATLVLYTFTSNLCSLLPTCSKLRKYKCNISWLAYLARFSRHWRKLSRWRRRLIWY
jgi:hypothetical protein